MIRNNNLFNQITFLLAPVFLLLLTSCGSYEYSGYGNDGIYGDVNNPEDRYNQRNEPGREQYAEKETNNSEYYKNLFAEKSQMYNDVLENGAIFTDVDEYSSTEGQDMEYYDDGMAYTGSYAPWGDDPDQYTINFYNNSLYGGFYNPYWGGAYPYYGNGYGYGYGYGGYWGDPFWNNYWGPSWRIGFGFPYWGPSFAYSYGYHSYFNPYFYNRNWYNGSRSGREVAYSSGRRSATGSYTSRGDFNSSDERSRNSSYSRSIREIRNGSSASNDTRSRTYSRSSDNDNTYSRSTRRSAPVRVYRDQSSNNTSYGRSNQSSRSSVRTSAPVRSSPSVRSSSSSGRSSSSATRSSGGGRSSSRGGRG